jgi:predicted hydrocarbon binding protein
MQDTVKVPDELAPAFEKAQERVRSYFEDRFFLPEAGLISVGDERYVLIRAESLSLRFFEYVRSMYPALEDLDAFHAAGAILYDLATGMGRSDAEAFAQKKGITDPLERLSCGPVLFAHAGWGFVEVMEASTPSCDADFFLLYDHIYSFESPSWTEARRLAPSPACFMSAGYSAGWCEKSYGIPLVAREVLCCAAGDACCRFIMAAPPRIDDRLAEYRLAHPELFSR